MLDKIYVDDKVVLDLAKVREMLERKGVEYSDELALDKGRRMRINPWDFDSPAVHRLNDGRVVLRNKIGLDDWMCWNSKRKLPEKSASLEEILLFSLEEKRTKLFFPKSYHITTPSGTYRPEYGVVGSIKEETKYLPEGGSYINYSWKSINLTYYADTRPGVIVQKIPEQSFEDFFLRENENIPKFLAEKGETAEKFLEHHLKHHPYGCGVFTKYLTTEPSSYGGYSVREVFYELV